VLLFTYSYPKHFFLPEWIYMMFFRLTTFYVEIWFFFRIVILTYEGNCYQFRNHFLLKFRFSEKSQFIAFQFESNNVNTLLTSERILWISQPLELDHYPFKFKFF
jgi:hypothetical protein